MRYLKLTSAKNPSTDFILLSGGYYDRDGDKDITFNGFNGFICTSFQPVGINRNLEFLPVKNKQFVVDNKINFKKYQLSIETLSRYNEYDRKSKELISFIERNKKEGFRLYYRPYYGDNIRYCLCGVDSLVVGEKLQPTTLTLSQCSLWLGEQMISRTSQTEESSENLFGFIDDGTGYYSAGFFRDEKVSNYYCVEFFGNITTEAIIINNSYNEIPLNIIIKGPCSNPVVSLFRKNEDVPIRRLEIKSTIDNGYYVEIISGIGENGVWYVNSNNGEKRKYTEYVNNDYGSPYFYIGNGEYVIKVQDTANNACETEILYQEEFDG